MKNYFKWRVNRAGEFLKLTKSCFSLKNKNVLDLGCGEGPLSYLLYKNKARVHAVDVSDKAISKMKKLTKNMKIDIRKAFGENLPYKNNFFDVIFAFDMLEHVKDVEKTFSEMHRCLKKGGYIFLEITPYYSLITGHHLYDFTLLPAQYLPKKLMKIWILRKKPSKLNQTLWKKPSKFTTPQQAWEQFASLNKLSISQVKKLAQKNNLKLLKENFVFKIPSLFETNINWIKYFGFLKEIIPMSYQAVYKKSLSS